MTNNGTSVLLKKEGEKIVAKQRQSYIKDFTRNVRANIYGLWRGDYDTFRFVDNMIGAIERYYRLAWFEGAEECGIKSNELTIEETDAMADSISSDIAFLIGFADDIADSSRDNGGKLAPLQSRGELWVNRYNSVRNHAKVMACGNQKLEWRLGATEEHCSTCNALHGKVKRASAWNAANLRPQNAPNPHLECEGWRCQCTLESTDKPLSRGPLPGASL